MSAAAVAFEAYLAAGLVRSVFKTRQLRALVAKPAGGLPRLVAVYLLCAMLWFPLDALVWLDARLSRAEGGP